MKRNWLLTLAVVILVVIIAVRAHLMPITHDEVATWALYLSENLFGCISNPKCWGTANNHWLNSFLMQCSTAVFGEEVWALRLPNILAGGLYFLCAALICSRYLKTHSLQLAGFLLLTAHPYLLDFFSLARGYGMMTAGIIWGIFGLLRYGEDFRPKWLIISILSFILAVLSNFLALVPWAAGGICWFLWILFFRKNNLIIRHGLYWVLSVLLLLILLYFPIKTLAGNDEFKWGAGSVLATGVDLMVNLLYSKKYLGEKSAEYFWWIITCLIVFITFLSFVIRTKEIRFRILFLFMMLAVNILLIMINKEITGAQSPVGRKSIYLIPYIFGILALGLYYLGEKTTGIITGYIISGLMIWHLINTLHIKSNREWYYDAYYPELFSAILPEGSESDSVYLSSTWIFQPALHFYQKTDSLPIGGIPYQRPLIIDPAYDYYYVELQDTIGMGAGGFVYDRQIGSFYLFRNKKKERH